MQAGIFALAIIRYFLYNHYTYSSLPIITTCMENTNGKSGTTATMIIVVILVVLVLWYFLGNKNDTKDAMDDAANAVENTMDDAADMAEEAADDVADAAQDVVDEAEAVVEGEAATGDVDAVATGSAN